MMFKKYLFSAAAFVLSIVAASGVGVYTNHWVYEPDAPDCLKRDL